MTIAKILKARQKREAKENGRGVRGNRPGKGKQMVRRRKGGKRKAKGRGKYGKEKSREGEKKMEECRETDGERGKRKWN